MKAESWNGKPDKNSSVTLLSFMTKQDWRHSRISREVQNLNIHANEHKQNATKV